MMFVGRSAEPAYAGDAADKMVGSNEGRSNINKHVATHFLSQTSTIAIARGIMALDHFRTMVGLCPIISIIHHTSEKFAYNIII